MLFKSTAELQQYTEVNSHVNFASLQASIRRAEKELLVPVFGIPFLNDIDGKYNADTLSSAETNLLKAMQAALAPFAMLLYIPKADVSVTDGGVRRMETEMAKTAFQYQVTSLKKAYEEETASALEYLIEYLELNKADFPVWTASEAFLKYRGLFIKTGGQFNEYFTTAAPWRNFLFLRPLMADIEQTLIKVQLGDAFFAALKEKEKTVLPLYSADEQQLLELVKKVIAYKTIAEAIARQVVRIDGTGISIISAGGSNDAESVRGGVSDNQLSHLRTTTLSWAETWLSKLSKFLQAKASTIVFPEYYTWQQSKQQFDNHPCEAQGLFGMF